jgi:hypothetical protein
VLSGGRNSDKCSCQQQRCDELNAPFCQKKNFRRDCQGCRRKPEHCCCGIKSKFYYFYFLFFKKFFFTVLPRAKCFAKPVASKDLIISDRNLNLSQPGSCNSLCRTRAALAKSRASPSLEHMIILIAVSDGKMFASSIRKSGVAGSNPTQTETCIEQRSGHFRSKFESPTHTLTHPPIQPSIHPTIHPSNHPSIQPSIHMCLLLTRPSNAHPLHHRPMR